MLKRALPNWSDEKGVAKLVKEILAERQITADRFRNFQPRYNPPLDDDDAAVESIIAEKSAVAVAYRGDIVPLTELLRDPHRNWLLPNTVELVVEFMTGKRNPQTGRPKGKPKGKGAVGRRKMTSEQRLAANPIHRAAFEATVLKQELRQRYRSQKAAEVRERALELAAKRNNVELGRLRRHLKLSKNDRRRLG